MRPAQGGPARRLCPRRCLFRGGHPGTIDARNSSASSRIIWPGMAWRFASTSPSSAPAEISSPKRRLRQRIARGDKDVVCPVCETRHNLTEGAAEARERDPEIMQRTWALRTEIEKRRAEEHSTGSTSAGTTAAKPVIGPIRLLHLSDLHFTAATPIQARLQWLLDDIKQDERPGLQGTRLPGDLRRLHG